MESVFAQDIKVMIVEDERIVAHHLKMTLLSFGYQVIASVPSGLEAVSAAEEKSPDIILMDVFLKGKMDGIEAANHIREKKDIPIIFITASAHDTILERIRASKPYGYLSKPFEDRELKTNIDMAMFRWRLEVEMKKERTLAKRYLDIAAVIIVALDKDGNIDMINQLGAKLLGYHSKELIGKNWFELNIPDSQYEIAKASFDEIIGGKQELKKHFENRIVTRYGVERTISWNSTMLYDEKGNVTGILSAGDDITEKKIAMDKLVTNERLLKRAQELAKIFTWEIDVFKGILYPDISSEPLFQNEEAPLLPSEGIKLSDFILLIHPDDKDSVEQAYINCIKKQKSYNITYRLITKSGIEKIIEDHIFHIKVENGLVTRIQGISQDVTSKRKIETALVQHDSSLLVINKLLSLNLRDVPFEKIIEQCLKIIVDIPFLELLPVATLFLLDDNTGKLKLRGHYGNIDSIEKDIEAIEAGHCITEGSDLIELAFGSNSIKESDFISYDKCSNHYHLLLRRNKKINVIIVLYARHQKNDNTGRCEFFKTITSTISNVIDKALIEEDDIAKLEELRQFQKVTIDREVKMVELKQRIAYLEAQLEQKQKN